MTAEARIPSDSTGWRAIDIFVFTNGQQHSPPRKYHLNAQELNWWKAILSFLARHSTIDLYTVDGEKLEGPLQLSNGAAYVAVKPPDHFKDTGYSKYLVKASRSWEKSQGRRSNSNEITKQDESNIPSMVTNTDTSNKKVLDEIQVNNTVFPEGNIIEKPHTLLNIHESPQRDSNASNKQSDKRRISPIQRSSILRKQVTTPPSTRKDPGKSKDAPKSSKAPLKVNGKAAVENGEIIPKTKIPQKNGKESSAVKPEQVVLKETDVPITLNNSNANILVIDTSKTENLHEKDDSLLVSNIFKSTDSEIPSVVVPLSTNPIAHDIDDKILNNITEELNGKGTEITTDIFNNVQKSDTFDYAFPPSSLENNLSHEMLNMSQIQKAPNVSFADIPDQNYVVTKNGDIVNLKLQIEVRNSGGTVNKKNKNEQKNYSSANIVKTEKGSQIDLDNEIIQNKSLQSIFMSEFIENVGVHRNSGVIVIKCACCQEKKYNTSNINPETSLNDSKMYVILLPTPGHDNNIERSQCDKKIIDIVEKHTRETHRSSLFNPVKKTTSKMDLEILHSLAEVSKVAKCPKIESETKPHVAIIEKDVINHTDEDKSIPKIDNIDNVDHGLVVNSPKILAKCQVTSDKSTQTELCSLLLEARRHEDGLYSFHLPPLHILRYYKL